MLIPLHHLIQTHNLKLRGVIHLGAHWAEEANDYYVAGVRKIVWVEANPDYRETISEVCSKYDWQYENLLACLSDVTHEVVEFNISNNDGQSSSILELGTHKEAHPEVDYIGTKQMLTQRVDYLLEKWHIKIDDYNFVNADLQGMELKALKGMGDMLHKIDYLYLEVNRQPTYIGAGLIDELEEYIGEFGFRRTEISRWIGDTWTDAFYLKS